MGAAVSKKRISKQPSEPMDEIDKLAEPQPVRPEAIQEPASVANGIECPRCGCHHFYVVWIRHRDSRIIRKRECRHCGRAIVTTERVAGT